MAHDDISKSLFGLIHSHEGRWVSEKQQNFLLSKFHQGKYVYVENMSFGEHEYNTAKNSRSITYIFHADTSGITSVEKTTANGTSVYWDNSPAMIQQFATAKLNRQFQLSLSDIVETLQKHQYDTLSLKHLNASRASCIATINDIEQKYKSHPNYDAQQPVWKEIIESMTSVERSKLQVIDSQISDLTQDLALPLPVSQEHLLHAELIKNGLVDYLSQQKNTPTKSKSSDFIRLCTEYLTTKNAQLDKHNTQELLEITTTQQLLSNIHTWVHRPKNQEYVIGDGFSEPLDYSTLRWRIAGTLAIKSDYSPLTNKVDVNNPSDIVTPSDNQQILHVDREENNEPIGNNFRR